MLTSSRFTSIPTRNTRQRLQQVINNTRPITRREPNRPSVMAIQAALADLNRNYLLPVEVDGYFGSRTYGAVEAFQRDYGLIADGQVGQQTISQLDSLFGTDVMRQPAGISIHIGVDRVDPAHYGGNFPLSSCVNDARKMQEFAQQLGYSTFMLLNEEATASNFTALMRSAIGNLYSGDSLFVTFSGHGSQVMNVSADAEDDGRDETLCFYDRMVIDDEIYAFLGKLAEGVRVHLVFDSCHSGSVAKVILMDGLDKDVYMNKTLDSLKNLLPAGDDAIDESDDRMMEARPIASANLEKALEGEKPVFQDAPVIKSDNDKDIADLFTNLFIEENTGPSKSIQLFSGIYDRNKMLYDTLTDIYGSKDTDQLLCTVVSISACQDSQTTPAGSYLSLFTANINQAWNSGGFDGSYREFHQSIIRSTGRPDVTPVISTYGTVRSLSMLHERPFAL